MPAVGVFAGLACGVLLTAIGLAVWEGFRQTPDLARAARVVNWLAGTLLLAGALLAWWGDPALSAPASRLLLMATCAAPVGTHHHYSKPWGNAARVLPALVLTGVALFGSLGPASAESGALMSLMLVVCGGLGARMMGEALSLSTDAEWPFTATYALLTLLVGGVALVNLWQRGTVWSGRPGEGGLVGAWLAWSAAWSSPRRYPRLRTGLIVIAALFLIVTVAT
ncbi:MAG: hypothetical protein DRJ03_12985 [Chloroflexi bacterium]|nr:MAG: hypothetical protein DRI81_03360 [Chloroflexota bacterium]RLC84915.1 MAG: hypothetical protein DRJ03_12985 [Chloroflexota bacterium]